MLEGKLCIAIIEEDNPQKSYFRVKPLLVRSETGYEPFLGGENFPEDGCLRIVPDKNESGHFKARMRKMGPFCVLDLRAFNEANEKIRPNKNFNVDEAEHNAFIIYSDVVREPAKRIVFEILEDASGVKEDSRHVLIGESAYDCCKNENDSAELVGVDLPENLIRYELEGFRGSAVRFAARFTQAGEEMLFASESAHAPAPVQITPVPVKPEPVPVPVSEAETQPPVALRPIRGRSLQEIIDDKWCHSRMEQLGHPVPPMATGMPVTDPVDAAVAAIRAAWEYPGLHERMLNEISRLGAFSVALEAHRNVLLNSEIRRELDELEAERLKALTGLDKLKQDKLKLREEFKDEIRAEQASEFAEMQKKIDEAKANYEELHAAEDKARCVVEQARDIAASITDGRFEKMLKNFMDMSHAAVSFAEREAGEPARGETGVSLETYVDRMMQSFACEGIAMDRIGAMDLLICVALGDRIMLSGSTGTDKPGYARAICRALGLKMEEVEVYTPDRQKAEIAADAVLIRGANRCSKIITIPKTKILFAELNDLGAGEPVDAEAFANSCLIRLRPEQDAPWRKETKECPEFPRADWNTLRTAVLTERNGATPAARHRMAQLRDALKAHRVYLSRRTLDRVWTYCAAMEGVVDGVAALDLALARSAVGAVLAEAPIGCLAEMREILSGLPECLALLDAPLPVRL